MTSKALRKMSIVFAILFLMSVGFGSYFLASAPTPNVIDGPQVDCGADKPCAKATKETGNEALEKTDFGGIATLITSVASALVSISTLLLAWRKERRDERAFLMSQGVVHTNESSNT